MQKSDNTPIIYVAHKKNVQTLVLERNHKLKIRSIYKDSKLYQ